MQGWFVVLVAVAYVTMLFVDRQPWRPMGVVDRRQPRAALYLRAQPGHILHVLDVLRIGRTGDGAQPRIPRHLYRPGSRLRVRLRAAEAHREARQGRENHVDRRFPRRALRQELLRGLDRHPDRHCRRHPLYRAAAQGDLRFGQPDDRVLYGRAAFLRSVPQRHFTGRGAAAGFVRRAVRHAPRRRDRAPGRADPRRRGGVGRQARRLSGGRPACRLRAVRRARRPYRQAGGKQRGAEARWTIAHRSAHGW